MTLCFKTKSFKIFLIFHILVINHDYFTRNSSVSVRLNGNLGFKDGGKDNCECGCDHGGNDGCDDGDDDYGGEVRLFVRWSEMIDINLCKGFG